MQTKIIEKKIPHPDKLGLCFPSGLIQIDPRQLEDDFLTTVVHELLHREFPDLSEDAVERVGVAMGKSLWKLGYRRIRQ